MASDLLETLLEKILCPLDLLLMKVNEQPDEMDLPLRLSEIRADTLFYRSRICTRAQDDLKRCRFLARGHPRSPSPKCLCVLSSRADEIIFLFCYYYRC